MKRKTDKKYFCPLHGAQLKVNYCQGFALFGDKFKWQAQCSDCEDNSAVGLGPTVIDAQLDFLEQTVNEEC